MRQPVASPVHGARIRRRELSRFTTARIVHHVSIGVATKPGSIRSQASPYDPGLRTGRGLDDGITNDELS